MTAYYNEIDPYCVAWLRNLIDAGELPQGDVDDRPIQQVSADDLRGYSHVHLFAGIGGWGYATRLAGWPDGRPLWSGSCPCQPYSVIGRRLADQDERNLWPEFRRLIDAARPATVVGEQVASKAGREWLAGVRADLEGMGYGVGAADLCAASVGAPHIRQRLWWVADLYGTGCDRESARNGEGRALAVESGHDADRCRVVCGGLGDAIEPRLEGYAGHGTDGGEPGWIAANAGRSTAETGRHSWGDEWIDCADHKRRRLQPGIVPLAHGVPARVGKLRAYGNAVVPQLAAQALIALREAVDGH